MVPRAVRWVVRGLVDGKLASVVRIGSIEEIARALLPGCGEIGCFGGVHEWAVDERNALSPSHLVERALRRVRMGKDAQGATGCDGLRDLRGVGGD